MWGAFVTFFLFLGIQFAGARMLPEGAERDARGLLVYAVASAFLVGATLHRRGTGALGRPTTSWLALGGVFGIGAGAFAIGYSTVARRFGVMMPDGSELPFVVGTLAYVVLAPISEEVFFRGWLQPAVGEESGGQFARFSPFVTAILFMMVHPPSSYLPALLVGVATGILRERSSSVFAGMMLHALNNACILFWFRRSIT